MSDNALTPDTIANEEILVSLSSRENDRLCDFEIKCGERVWRVHRLVLSLHSTVLAAACSKGFKEAADGMIDLSEDREKCVDTLVFYLYNLNYDGRLLAEGSNLLDFHVKMCILADKYDIQPLKMLAADKFEHEVKRETLRCRDGELAEAATRVYEAPQPTVEIQDHIVDVVVKRKYLNDAGPLEFIMRKYADFATDVAIALQTARSGSPAAELREPCYTCPKCGYAMRYLHPYPLGRYGCFACEHSMTEDSWRDHTTYRS